MVSCFVLFFPKPWTLPLSSLSEAEGFPLEQAWGSGRGGKVRHLTPRKVAPGENTHPRARPVTSVSAWARL